jgi:hypothetical protein
MFSLTQILLFILVFLAAGFTLFVYFISIKNKKTLTLKHLLIISYVFFISLPVLILFYSARFIKQFGFEGFILLAVIGLIGVLSFLNLSMRLNLLRKLKKLKLKNVKI